MSPGHAPDYFKQVAEKLHLTRFRRRISGVFFKLLCEYEPRTAKCVRCVPNGGFGDHDILTIFLTYPIHIVKKKVESSVPVRIVRHTDNIIIDIKRLNSVKPPFIQSGVCSEIQMQHNSRFRTFFFHCANSGL